MKSTKTESEEAFEAFLTENRLGFEKIPEADMRRPDYLVHANGLNLTFEVKELAEDEKYGVVSDPTRPVNRSYSSTLGNHVRRFINSSRGQVRYGADNGLPSILLIYNKLDPLFQLGTNDRDFETAMYGELTFMMDRGTHEIVDEFHGRNQSLREDKNTEFSAVGKLYRSNGKLAIKLFENVYAKVMLPFDRMPGCFEVIRVEITD
jgi:hypothetical protein